MRDMASIFLKPKAKAVSQEKTVEKAVRHNIQDYAPIFKNNPFGFPAGQLTPISSESSKTPATDITLIGTVSGRKDVSYAIFMDKSGQQEVFKIGDSVFGIGFLNKVDKDRVFIKSLGNEIEILFADIAVIENVKTDKKQPAGFVRQMGDSTYVVDQQKIQQALERTEQILTDARLIPNIADGKQSGFILQEVKNGGIFHGLGMRNGDVILRVNEYNISNPEAALQAFTALKGMDRVQLDIIRSGTKMTMTYMLN
jgi:general secretion pathway protein C